MDANGDWKEDNEAMRALIDSYFQNLFTAEVHVVNQEVLEKVKPRVTPYIEEEVKRALFSIDDLKAPGPYGLHAIFYKKFWHLIGDDLTKEVLYAVSSGVIPEGWNTTTIVLIPKVDTPENVSQFRPISLCNVVTK